MKPVDPVASTAIEPEPVQLQRDDPLPNSWRQVARSVVPAQSRPTCEPTRRPPTRNGTDPTSRSRRSASIVCSDQSDPSSERIVYFVRLVPTHRSPETPEGGADGATVGV